MASCLPCWRLMQPNGRPLFPFCNSRVCESLIIACYMGSRVLPSQQRACCLVVLFQDCFSSLPLPYFPLSDPLRLTLPTCHTGL